MLIGVLIVVAAGLLVAAFLTGWAPFAIGAVVVSVAAAVVFVVLLRRGEPTPAPGAPRDTAGDDEDAEPATTTATVGTSGEKTATATKTATKSKPATKTRSATEPEDAAPADAGATTVDAPAAPAESKPAAAPAASPEPSTEPSTEPEPTRTASAPTTTGTTSGTTAGTADAPTELQGSDIVHVLPGRLRYHVAGCELLAGHETEALTLDDAKDEGFSACSRCATRGALSRRS